jgi:hypothetical protein
MNQYATRMEKLVQEKERIRRLETLLKAKEKLKKLCNPNKVS